MNRTNSNCVTILALARFDISHSLAEYLTLNINCAVFFQLWNSILKAHIRLTKGYIFHIIYIWRKAPVLITEAIPASFYRVLCELPYEISNKPVTQVTMTATFFKTAAIWRVGYELELSKWPVFRDAVEGLVHVLGNFTIIPAIILYIR